jgi:hypothetical protein
MRKLLAFSTLLSAVALASEAFASVVPVAAPAPLLGAGIPSLAVLAVAGVGYVVMHVSRKNRD